MRIFLISLTFLLISALKAFAGEELFLPEEQEQRAQNLFLQVKCLVCEGQVIENSNSGVAFELRKLIREQIQTGLSDKDIKNYLVSNYGPEILTSPPLNKHTLLLWLLPLIFFVIGFFVILKDLCTTKIERC